MKIIAHIETDFETKFGLPRQSGLVEEIQGRIIFEKEYRNPEAFRGLEDFSRIWLIWQFSQAQRDNWSPTVRPPLLGGNTRMGVFATRSPFRPNPIGLSCVKLERIEFSKEFGPVIYVRGADLMNGTPIYDIKPYLPYADSYPDAAAGFTVSLADRQLNINIDNNLLSIVPEAKQKALVEILAQDPRPSYQDDPERVYGFGFAGFDIKFKVDGKNLTVIDIVSVK